MERTLTRINTLAIPLLVLLCVIQWTRERRLHLELGQFRLAQHDLRMERDRLRSQTESLGADLERFKERYRASEEQQAALRRRLEELTAEAERRATEATQLRAALSNWVEAVHQRDAQLQEAVVRIQTLNQQLMTLADRYQLCATNYQRLLELYERQSAALHPGTNRPADPH